MNKIKKKKRKARKKKSHKHLIFDSIFWYENKIEENKNTMFNQHVIAEKQMMK